MCIKYSWHTMLHQFQMYNIEIVCYAMGNKIVTLNFKKKL